MSQVEKFIICKKKNVRIYLSTYKKDDGTSAIVIQTKRLNDFKKRQIAQSDVIYSPETLKCIGDMVAHLFGSTYGKKNLEWQIPNEKFEGKTNIEV